MSEWQPIEIAPKDGSLVLVCESHHPWIGIGRYIGRSGLWKLNEGWEVWATHWMPLPEPPEDV